MTRKLLGLKKKKKKGVTNPSILVWDSQWVFIIYCTGSNSSVPIERYHPLRVLGSKSSLTPSLFNKWDCIPPNLWHYFRCHSRQHVNAIESQKLSHLFFLLCRSAFFRFRIISESFSRPICRPWPSSAEQPCVWCSVAELSSWSDRAFSTWEKKPQH